MSFQLQLLNVVRIVESEVEKSRLIDKGFELLEEIKGKIEGDKTPGENPPVDTLKEDPKGKATK